MKSFERSMELLSNTDGEWFIATTDVTDTAANALQWLKETGAPFGMSDVLALTALILERKRDRENAP